MAVAPQIGDDDDRLMKAALLASVAKNRDRKAFADLFGFYAPRLKSFFLRNGADWQAAEDLVQEVMLSIWNKADQFDPQKASVGTWVFTIARNRRIDALRRERRPEPDADDPAFVPAAEPAADTFVERTQQRREVQRVLAELPPEQAEPIKLAFFGDLSHSMIAEKLDLPLGTVKARIRLAMAKLRPALGALK